MRARMRMMDMIITLIVRESWDISIGLILNLRLPQEKIAKFSDFGFEAIREGSAR